MFKTIFLQKQKITNKNEHERFEVKLSKLMRPL